MLVLDKPKRKGELKGAYEMRRVFYESKLFDYTTKEEAEKHIEEMKNKGWAVKTSLYENGQDTFPYSVEYHKQR